MKSRLGRTLAGVALLLALLIFALPGHAQGRTVYVLEVDGPVMPTMASYFERGIETAVAADAEALLIVLDTPGGMVDTTQQIVQHFRASPVPVIVYVSPRGAQAASAGSIITLAAHASGMAPETVIGAASPVGEGGAELDETISRKIKEDLKATVRNLTAARGEQATALAEEMIEDARAVTAEEALNVGLIDAVAADSDALLQQLDGRTVIVDNRPVTLQTAAATQQPLPLNTVEQVLFALANPVLIGILLTLGVQAILIELSNPGGWIAGFLGVLALGLGLYGLGQLPVNYLGLGLIILAFVLFVMEAFTPTKGALAATGTAVLIGGLLVLFNSPGTPDFVRLSVPAAAAIGLFSAVLFIFIVGKAISIQRSRPTTGVEGLMGKRGPVRSKLTSRNLKPPYTGMVLVAGELWRAQADEEVEPGEMVVVTAVDGFTLHVMKAHK